MSVDVEKHSRSMRSRARSCGAWTAHENQVERNTDRVLQVFADHGVRSTFRPGLGSGRCPGLIRRIVGQGHELASHGYCHIRADGCRQGSRGCPSGPRACSNAGRAGVIGYRAASFSIGKRNWWAFDVLAEKAIATARAFPDPSRPVRRADRAARRSTFARAEG
jgi:hypothetical protein